MKNKIFDGIYISIFFFNLREQWITEHQETNQIKISTLYIMYFYAADLLGWIHYSIDEYQQKSTLNKMYSSFIWSKTGYIVCILFKLFYFFIVLRSCYNAMIHFCHVLFIVTLHTYIQCYLESVVCVVTMVVSCERRVLFLLATNKILNIFSCLKWCLLCNK